MNVEIETVFGACELEITAYPHRIWPSDGKEIKVIFGSPSASWGSSASY